MPWFSVFLGSFQEFFKRGKSGKTIREFTLGGKILEAAVKEAQVITCANCAKRTSKVVKSEALNPKFETNSKYKLPNIQNLFSAKSLG